MSRLQFVGLKRSTLERYKKAIAGFFQYLENEGIAMPKTSHQLDKTLAAYIEHMWRDDLSLTYAGHLLSGFRRFCPHLRWKTPRAKQYFANWKSCHVPKQAVPLPAATVMAMAGTAIQMHRPTLAAILLTGYLAFLRTGEMTALSPSKMEVNPSTGVIVLALTATKTSKNQEESLSFTDQRVAILLHEVLRRANGRPLWPTTTNTFRDALQDLLTRLHLQSFGFSAYSIRRGAASHAFASGASFDRLLVQGRWQSPRTARLYLDTGRAALIQLRFSPHQITLQQKAIKTLEEFIEQLRRRRIG